MLDGFPYRSEKNGSIRPEHPRIGPRGRMVVKINRTLHSHRTPANEKGSLEIVMTPADWRKNGVMGRFPQTLVGSRWEFYHRGMNRSVTVHWLPTMFSLEDLRGGVAVVIDVLRASTTIAQALAAGAEAVMPFGEVADAKAYAANLPPGSFLLGGERGGVRIEGFDLGNSPLEYTPDMVSGRTVLFTTTNGTKALKQCELAERIVIGSFANMDAIAKEVGETSLPVHLVCAGTEGAMSAEDVLCAGGLISDLQRLRGRKILTDNDANRLAFELYVSHSESEASFLEALRESAGGRNLGALGYEADIKWAAKRNRFQIVPEYNRETGRIEASAR